MIHRKASDGFRSAWGAAAYAAFLSIVQTIHPEGEELFPSLLGLPPPRDPARLGPTSDA